MLSLFVTEAHAMGAQGGGGGDTSQLMGLMPLVLMFVIFYFLLIRPQNKRQKEHREMVANLGVGDEIVTAGGVLGRITGISDHYAVVQVSDNTEIKITKSSVSAVVPKGTFDEA